ETAIHNYVKQQQSPIRTKAKLEIDTLGLPGEPLRNIKIALVQLTNAWQAKLMSPTITGEVYFPNNPKHRPILARLRHLRLALPNTAPKIPPPKHFAYSSLPDPHQASALDLYVDDLQIDTTSMGKLFFKARPQAMGLKIVQLMLNGSLFTITGTGRWIGTPENQQTKLYVKGQSPNLGQALRNLGFKSALHQSSIQMQANLHSSTSIYGLTPANLVGKIKFQLSKGYMIDVDPGVGRFFGLISLEAIQRRLSLDFSDVFGKGFSFNSFDGLVTLKNGNATTAGVEITGPIANIVIRGRTGLVTQDYDQTIIVTPKISNTLPIAGALTSGPIGAAAMLLTKQIVGNEINQLAQFRYKLTGSWDKPEFEYR
ncbi:hypothetical protein TI03_04740, partial [Achromatium sp. WMS1]